MWIFPEAEGRTPLPQNRFVRTCGLFFLQLGLDPQEPKREAAFFLSQQEALYPSLLPPSQSLFPLRPHTVAVLLSWWHWLWLLGRRREVSLCSVSGLSHCLCKQEKWARVVEVPCDPRTGYCRRLPRMELGDSQSPQLNPGWCMEMCSILSSLTPTLGPLSHARAPTLVPTDMHSKIYMYRHIPKTDMQL